MRQSAYECSRQPSTTKGRNENASGNSPISIQPQCVVLARRHLCVLRDYIFHNGHTRQLSFPMKPTSPTTQPAQSPDAKAGHTPGPWRISEIDHRSIWGADDCLVANCVHDQQYEAPGKVAWANAQLIAASPAYYAAAEQAIKAWDEMSLPEDTDICERSMQRAFAPMRAAMELLAAAHAEAKGKV